MMEKIKVVICDDQPDILEYFCDIVNSEDITVVGVAQNGADALKVIEKTQPHICLMDIQMESECDGINAIEQITMDFPDVKCIVLTIHNSDDLIVNAYLAGAVDYIIKTTDKENIQQNIRNVFHNSNFIGSLINEKLHNELYNMRATQKSLLFIINELSKLTPSELSIMKDICKGHKQRSIAKEKNIEISTIKFHVNNILKKLHFKSMRELTSFLESSDLLDKILHFHD